MRKNVTQLELDVDGKRFLFICDSDTPLSIVKNVLMNFHAHCDEVEKAIIEQMEKEKQSENTEQCCEGE